MPINFKNPPPPKIHKYVIWKETISGTRLWVHLLRTNKTRIIRNEIEQMGTNYIPQALEHVLFGELQFGHFPAIKKFNFFVANLVTKNQI